MIIEIEDVKIPRTLRRATLHVGIIVELVIQRSIHNQRRRLWLLLLCILSQEGDVVALLVPRQCLGISNFGLHKCPVHNCCWSGRRQHAPGFAPSPAACCNNGHKKQKRGCNCSRHDPRCLYVARSSKTQKPHQLLLDTFPDNKLAVVACECNDLNLPRLRAPVAGCVHGPCRP